MRVARCRRGSLTTFMCFSFRRAPQPSSAQDHLVPVHCDVIGSQSLTWIALQFAVRKLPIPMVPRATDDPVLDNDLALAERRALVRTRVVDGKKIVADPEHRNGASPGLHGDRRPGWDVANLADDILGHVRINLLLLWRPRQGLSGACRGELSRSRSVRETGLVQWDRPPSLGLPVFD